MKRCPKCGNKEFIVTAHVVQEWLVDKYGEFIKATQDCVCVSHYPDDDDIWQCESCGYDGAGSEFEDNES